MRRRTPSHTDDLEPCVSVWRVHLELGGEHREQEDLDCRTGGIPPGAGDAIVVRYGGRLAVGLG
jgi:hypothetical protein